MRNRICSLPTLAHAVPGLSDWAGLFTHGTTRRSRVAHTLGVLMSLAVWLGNPAIAQVSDTQGAALAGQAQHWIDDNLAQLSQLPASSEQAAALRMEVKVGALDPRLRLAPCAQTEFYLPNGTRLWGRARIGIRCVDGATHWNVFLPIVVKAYGKAWVLNRAVQAGEVLRADDAHEAVVDWAEDASPILTKPSDWAGTVAARSMNAGQAVRASVVREQTVFNTGATVKLVAQGGGFQIATQGQALSTGAVGRMVRVRTPSGSVLSGTVVDENTVRLDL